MQIFPNFDPLPIIEKCSLQNPLLYACVCRCKLTEINGGHLLLQTELSERLRLRRGRGDTSEDDEGLPRSPCNSPTVTEGFLDKTGIKVSNYNRH